MRHIAGTLAWAFSCNILASALHIELTFPVILLVAAMSVISSVIKHIVDGE